MTCQDVRSRLDDYVDGDLPEAAFQETELHLSGCEACRGEERALRALLARAAALPREVAPARDLWPEVAARLSGSEGLRAVERPWLRWGPRPALAAAAALALAVSAAWWVRGRGPEAGAPAGTLVPVALEAPRAALAEADRSYARATADLMAALDAQKDTLSPETRRALDENLKTIDEALAQVRAALEKDPGNAQLAHLLTSTHQKRLGALQRVVRLNRL